MKPMAGVGVSIKGNDNMDKIETRTITITATVKSSTSIGFLLDRQKQREVTDIYSTPTVCSVCIVCGCYMWVFCMWVCEGGREKKENVRREGNYRKRKRKK